MYIAICRNENCVSISFLGEYTQPLETEEAEKIINAIHQGHYWDIKENIPKCSWCERTMGVYIDER